MLKAVMNWSGGKDAALCLQKLLREEDYQIVSLLTTVNRHHRRVSQHGLRVELLEEQAARIGLPVTMVEMPRYPSMGTYNRLMADTLRSFQAREVTTAIFGDILLEDLRTYREEQLAEVGFTGLFPLWKEPTDKLVREFIDAGFKAVVVCVDEEHLDKSFVGRELDEDFLRDLPAGVDPCGENGEFHTFVYDGPIFQQPVVFTRGETVYRTYEPREADDADITCGSEDGQRLPEKGFWYCDLLSVGASVTSDITRSRDAQ